MLKFFYSLLLCILLFFSAQAQVLPDLGQFQPSIHWRKITTPHYKIVYPLPLEQEAQRLANTAEALYFKESHSLKAAPSKTTIVLQNQGMISNGYVRLAPKMSEFYATPPQEFETNDWINTLSLHELRHVVQFQALSGKLDHIPLTEYFRMMMGLPIPFWFFEGDAVVIETALSNSGRGRLPSWEMPFRANVLSHKKYSYSKYYLGSLKNVVPDYYRLGYFMNAKMRRDSGNVVLERFAKQPYLFVRNFKQNTNGYLPHEYFKLLNKELDSLWSNQERTSEIHPPNITKASDEKSCSNYHLPQRSNGKTYAIASSFDKTAHLVEIDPKGHETEICYIGSQSLEHFHINDQILVWDELRYHPRFKRSNFQVICTYNLKTKKRKQLTHKTRYFSPSLSPDNQRIAVVEVQKNNQCRIVELDARDGSILKTYITPPQYILQTPSFSPNGKFIITTISSAEGKNLLLIDRNKNTSLALLKFENQQLSRPKFVTDSLIIFKAHYTGIDNLYSLNLANQSIQQITFSRFGASNPAYHPQDSSIYYNDYQYHGYAIARCNIHQKTSSKLIHSFENHFINYSQPIVKQEFGKNVLDSIPNIRYTSQPFREIYSLFYFHSIIPYVGNTLTNLDASNVRMGAQLLSNNLLNTSDFSAYIYQNNENQMNNYGAYWSYKKFLPIFSIYYDNIAKLLANSNYTYRTHDITSSISVPLKIYRYQYYYSLLTGLSSGIRVYTSDELKFKNNTSNFATAYTFSISRLHNTAIRDIFPKWGQSLYLTYRHYPFNNVNDNALAIQSAIYLPALHPNHGFKITFNYQHTIGMHFNGDQFIPYVTGYSLFNRDKPLVKNTLFLNYVFPIAYPDFDINSYWFLNLYIKRIRGNLFTDFENIFHSKAPLQSYGVEILSDLHVLRFINSFTIGCRMALSPQDRGNIILLPIVNLGF